MEHISLIIIGGGPIGLSCGIAAQAAGVEYKILEKGALVNSLSHFPTDMTFFSSSNNLELGGLPFTSLSLRPNKLEALEYYRRVTEHFDLNIALYEAFESIEHLSEVESKGRFQIKTSKAVYSCNNIVNATGFYDTPVMMNVRGEELDKVRHYYTSGHHLFKQKVAVIGASNSAVDVALESNRKGAEVSLIIRGKEIGDNVKYWIKPDLESRIKEGQIKLYLETEVQEFTDHYIILKSKGEVNQIENDFVYAMTGYKPNFKLAESLGIALDAKTGVPDYDDSTMKTNVEGVYLAGVVCGGLNTRKWYIENSRDHGDKIMASIKSKPFLSCS